MKKRHIVEDPLPSWAKLHANIIKKAVEKCRKLKLSDQEIADILNSAYLEAKFEALESRKK